TSAIVLAPGATVSGFVVQPGANGIDAVTTQGSCTATETAAAVLSAAKVLGQNEIAGTSLAFVAGARQQGGCALTVRNVVFQGVATGVASTGGTLVVDACTIGRGRRGILVDPGQGGGTPFTFNAVIQATTISGGSDTGVEVRQGYGSLFTMTGNTITQNCATTKYGTLQHLGGGIVFVGSLPTAKLSGNRIYGNGFDQVLVASTSGAIDLSGDPNASGAQCPDPLLVNEITCPDGSTSPSIYGLESFGAQVKAIGNAWSNAPPSAPPDYSGGVNTGYATSQYCPISTLSLSCPAIVCP
ncbi:MAG TPA: right-handed parallel beta-helix repeat-containing protein, partial [Anaeromyxobacteraceae bacterium]